MDSDLCILVPSQGGLEPITCNPFTLEALSVTIFDPFAYTNETVFFSNFISNFSAPLLYLYNPIQKSTSATFLDDSSYLFCFYNPSGDFTCESLGQMWLWVMSFISLIACILVIIRYFRIKVRGTALTMILILSLADMLNHLGMFHMWLFDLIDPTFESKMGKWYDFVPLGQFFSMFWAPFIARYVYKVLSDPKFSEGKKSLLIQVLITLILSIGFLIWTNPNPPDSWTLPRFQYMGAFSIITIALIITCAYYIKCVLILRKLEHPFKDAVKPWIRSLLLYAFAQLLTEGPYILICLYGSIIDAHGYMPYNFGMNVLATSGFANAMIFLFQSKKALNLPAEEAKTKPKLNISLTL